MAGIRVDLEGTAMDWAVCRQHGMGPSRSVKSEIFLERHLDIFDSSLYTSAIHVLGHSRCTLCHSV